ncbi:hypothetical protein L3N51_02295 [Metallosphaera sp. J1]|uniref:hypothetical protein n=1 Tax=Metallosphaera javensis (ex Hofmann et al. 2022) TaxID=99938 RepID=UPI001EDF1BCF|nr:hypothetical protein [Metallosphaera javensis (ex Hofmann et al. 2022)]MCG3109998.1 hypothetical protein [Metallosphaera javensis (ex Hofmann et al. 2022)]
MKSLIQVTNEFFQYRKKGDDEILEEALENLDYERGRVRIRDEVIKVSRRRDVVGVYLANIPYLILGDGEIHQELPEKVMKAQDYAMRLMECGLNDLATLESYLILEMGLRSLYSAWMGEKVTIRYGKRKVKVGGVDYRKLKLYIRKKGWSKYRVRVKGEVFPFSQGLLLSWAERFVDQRTSLALRLSINVRNLLAHGELEWNLHPTLSNVRTCSHVVWNMFRKLDTEGE